MSDIRPGDLLDGRFEIEALLHRGGMALVFRARDRATGQPVAIKAPLLEFEQEVTSYTRFEREDQIGRLLDHPSILKIVATEGRKSRPYVAMELLQGKTLNYFESGKRPLPEVTAAGIGSRICAALEHMHSRHIVHRDLKPENIMVCTDGSLRILDFGIAKAGKLRRLTYVAFSSFWGTPDYMAPEQARGERGDHRSDLYSLGAILYELTTGRLPFEGENPLVVMNARLTGDPVAPRQHREALTPAIEEIILHAMARDPRDRYDCASEMRRELDHYECVKLVGRFRNLQAPLSGANPGNRRLFHLVLAFTALQFGGFGFLFWYFSHHPGRH